MEAMLKSMKLCQVTPNNPGWPLRFEVMNEGKLVLIIHD
jgi:hypothetical protein